MRLCVLRSGSSANCTFVEHGATRLLIDAGGLSRRGLTSALAEIGMAFSDLQALVVTHLHSDHLNASALSLCKEHGVPLFVHENNETVLDALMNKSRTAGVRVTTFSCRGFSIGAIEFSPFVVDHDAQGITCGFIFFPSEKPLLRVSFATDLGCIPDAMVRHFADCNCIVLESNHDTDMLWNNPYRPRANKQRIASDSGHLSNEQAAQALVKICAASRAVPRIVVLSHLSKDHNSHSLAIAHVSSALALHGFAPEVRTAFRDRKTDFIECR